MAFPVTIDGFTRAPEAPAYYGPFLVGTDLYVFNTFQNALSGDSFVLAFKSTDDGATWTELDSGNRPQINSNDPLQVTCCQSTLDPTLIYCVYIDINVGIPTVQIFDVGAQAWGAVLGQGFIGGFQTAVYRESDNSLVVFCGFSSTPDGVHDIVSFAVFDIGAGTFGVPIDLDFQDYADPTLWDQLCCGAVMRSDGTISVFMQQKTRSTLPQSQVFLTLTPGSSSPQQVPFDCPVWDLIDVTGGGGGGAGAGPADGGGGGGGGESSQTNVPATPLALIPFTVGAGGLQNTDGGDSDWDSGLIVAGGGKKGIAGPGGAGGAGDNVGGDGGLGQGVSGGGGGGNGTIDGPGQNGVDGDGTNGGVGGLDGSGNSGGGKGGQVLNNQEDGNTGQRGGGGGASSNGGLNVGDGGTGADGQILLVYTPFTNSHPSRMWQQSIKADNSLTVLTEIAEGEYPIDGGGQRFVNGGGVGVPFDCKAGNGFVVIAFAWTTASGLTNMLVGKALNADVLVFTFQTVDTGNAGSGIDPTPALAVKTTGVVVLVYVSAPDLVTVNYVRRVDAGSGFGAAIGIGAFNDAGCRLRAEFFNDKTMGTFGQPVPATTSYIGAG